MPVGKIIKTRIEQDPTEALSNIIAFIESETSGLSDRTELLYGLNVGTLRKSVETMLYVLANSSELNIPADFAYIKREGPLFDELENIKENKDA